MLSSEILYRVVELGKFCKLFGNFHWNWFGLVWRKIMPIFSCWFQTIELWSIYLSDAYINFSDLCFCNEPYLLLYTAAFWLGIFGRCLSWGIDLLFFSFWEVWQLSLGYRYVTPFVWSFHSNRMGCRVLWKQHPAFFSFMSRVLLRTVDVEFRFLY